MVMDHRSWDEQVEEGPLKVVCNEPAKHRTDALPIGNGRLGAMVWGCFASELIQLNGKETMLARPTITSICRPPVKALMQWFVIIQS